MTCIEDEIPFEIPEKWIWVRLKTLCNIYTGNSINETEKQNKYHNLVEGYPYIATKDIGYDNTIDYKNGIRIPFENEKFRVAPPNAPLLCIEGGSAGRKIAITNQHVCFGNKLCCFLPYVAIEAFVYFYLQTPDFISVFNSSKNGIIGGVSVNTLKEILCPLPPFEEQKKIAPQIKTLLFKAING